MSLGEFKMMLRTVDRRNRYTVSVDAEARSSTADDRAHTNLREVGEVSPATAFVPGECAVTGDFYPAMVDGLTDQALLLYLAAPAGVHG